MKNFSVLILYFIFVTISTNDVKAKTYLLDDDDGLVYGTDWVLFTDENNLIHFINITKLPDDFEPDSIGNVYFHLYTRANPDNYEELFIDEDDTGTSDNKYNSSYFLEYKDVKVVTHGWLSSGNSTTVLDIKDAYLDNSDLNVIIVDWGEIAKNMFYPSAAKRTRFVGNQTGKLIKSLIKHYSISSKVVHLIGHSLGAQVVGFAGRWLKGNGMKVDRVTGLDPARPFFEIPPPEDGIKADDADFVDIIHTNGGILGELHSHGIADFYPNGGSHQEGCNFVDEISAACSHSRSHRFFMYSIRIGGFLARRCDSWKSYKEGKCKDNDAANMGHLCKNTTIGDYYLYTNAEPPYSKDEE